MKTAVLVALIVTACVPPVRDTSQAPSDDDGITVERDRYTGAVSVRMAPMHAGDLDVMGLASPTLTGLTFMAVHARDWRWLYCDRVDALIDGQSVRLSATKLDGKAFHEGRQLMVREAVYVILDQEHEAALAAAELVELRACGLDEARLEGRQLARLQAFLAKAQSIRAR